MERPDLQNNWEKYRENIKREYPDMPEEDLRYELDKEEEVLEKLQRKTGKTRAEIYKWLHMMG